MKKSAVVCGFSHTSLSTLRCLADKDIDVWLVGTEDRMGPAYFSNIPQRKIVCNNGLVQCLSSIGKNFSEKPALLLTEDSQVVDLVGNIASINEYYRYLLPPQDTANLLMDKSEFNNYASRRGYRIPKTRVVTNRRELQHIEHEFPFPFLFKPYLLHSRKINTRSELENYIDSFAEINFKSMIIQEWVPGGDDQLYFCFLFFDRKSRPRAIFTAKKIRQYPMQYGTTSFCISEANPYIVEESIRIFRELHYRGFCSIEYKYDSSKNEYIIMEPTVGRFNQQVALTDAAGVNFPLLILDYLYSDEVENVSQMNGKYWIYETNDFFSAMKSVGIIEYLRSLGRADTRVLFSRRDPLPLFAEIYDITTKKLRKTVKGKVI
jgi:D-aspartate ligase